MKKYVISVFAFCALTAVAFAGNPIQERIKLLPKNRLEIQKSIEPEEEKEPSLVLRDPFTQQKISFWEFYRYEGEVNWEIEFSATAKSPFKMSFEEVRMEPWILVGRVFKDMRVCPEESMCHFTKDEDGGELIFIMEPDSLYHGEWDLRWRHIDKTYQLVYDFGYHTQAGIPVTAFQVEHWMKWNPFGEVIPLLRDMACEGF